MDSFYSRNGVKRPILYSIQSPADEELALQRVLTQTRKTMGGHSENQKPREQPGQEGHLRKESGHIPDVGQIFSGML